MQTRTCRGTLQQATPKCPDSRTGKTETENGPLPDIDERTGCFRKSKLHRSQSAFSGHVQHALTTCAPWVFGGRLNRRLCTTDMRWRGGALLENNASAWHSQFVLHAMRDI